MILVTGAGGNVGGELVRALVNAGMPARALVRDVDRAQVPDGVVPVTGDLNDPTSLAPALEGVRAVFLLPGYGDMPGIHEQAALAGVERVVQLSSPAAESRDLSNAVTRYMVASEDAARDSPLSTVILRASGFMSNTLQWVPQVRDGDTIRAPFAAVPVAMIDPSDIAGVAVRLLTDGGHDGRTYWVSGPEALLPGDRARVLGEVLGRDLHLEPQSDDDARTEMTAAMPREYVDAFFDFYADGALDESPVRSTVGDVTGRPARTFRDWATAHADAFGVA